MATSAAPGPSDDDIHAPAAVRPTPHANHPQPPDPAVPAPRPRRDRDDTAVNGPATDSGAPPTPTDAIRTLHATGVPAPTLALAVPFLTGWSTDSPIQPVTTSLPPCPDHPDDRVRAIVPHNDPCRGLPLPPPENTVAAPPDRPSRPDAPDRSDHMARPPSSRRPRAVEAPHRQPTGRLQVSAHAPHPTHARPAPPDAAATPPPRAAPGAFHRWSRNFVQALIEALDGERPLRQLECWVHPEVYRALNRLDRRPGPDRRRGRRRAALRSLRITHPVPDVAEVAATYTRAGDRAHRCHVAALRIEPGGQGWVCTAVSLG